MDTDRLIAENEAMLAAVPICPQCRARPSAAIRRTAGQIDVLCSLCASRRPEEASTRRHRFAPPRTRAQGR